MTDNNYIVLMAGGTGTRLWPVSRESMPKQFQRFERDKSLIQETYEHVKNLVPSENIFISLGPAALKETQKQLKEINKKNYIIEPISKNTGPSIALVAAKIFKKDPSAVIATIASDHIVTKVNNYRYTFKNAFEFVKNNPQYLVTVGITPDRPHTGFGYIKVGAKIGKTNVRQAEKFVEKPDMITAKKYVSSGKYMINASYFIFSAGEMIKMFENLSPQIYKGLRNILKAIDTAEENKVTKEEFEKFPKIPIDTAIAEKAKNIAVIPADLGWSDVGSWTVFYDLLQSDRANVISRGHHVGLDDKNCLFIAGNKLLATVGLEDIIVVDTPDVTLVCHKNKAQEVKNLISKLKEQGKSQYL